MLGGPLAHSWDWLIRQANQLSKTFNPRMRLSDRPDGVVDWGQTLARGLYQVRQEYVVRSSAVGLDEQEHATLRGWIAWIAAEWAEYVQNVGIVPAVEWPAFGGDQQVSVPPERLRLWAHTAKRSRWPLLHGIVAESLRPFLEPEELDRIPLPSNEAVLFELVCLVRVARCVAPTPRELRWLTAETDNEIKLDGASVFYQQSLDTEQIIKKADEGELASAIAFFGVGIPRRVDLAFDFEEPRAGFDGIIIEAKSGIQQFDATVAQLRTYRAARRRQRGSRYLIWGVIESPSGPEKTLEDFQRWFAAANRTADVWVFSSADAIPIVLTAALGANHDTRSPLIAFSTAPFTPPANNL